MSWNLNPEPPAEEPVVTVEVEPPRYHYGGTLTLEKLREAMLKVADLTPPATVFPRSFAFDPPAFGVVGRSLGKSRMAEDIIRKVVEARSTPSTIYEPVILLPDNSERKLQIGKKDTPIPDHRARNDQKAKLARAISEKRQAHCNEHAAHARKRAKVKTERRYRDEALF